LTAEENLLLFAKLQGIAEPGARAAALLEEVGLSERRGSLVRTFSRGMRQRVAIARALLSGPSVLLLDEPASGLDPKARLELRELLRSMRDQGATILISSHILTELEGFCTSIGIMEKGRLVRTGRIEEVTAEETPTRIVRLRWVGDSAESVRRILAERLELSNISLDGNGGSFHFVGSDDLLAQVLATLVSANVRVTSFGEIKQTVEDLYMKLSQHEVM